MQHRLDGRGAVVCGASEGIGRAVAEVLAEAGARLLLVARNAERLQQLCNALVPHPEGHDILPVDFDDTTALQQALSGLRCRSYHILINNAGGPPAGPLVRADIAELTRAFRRHVIASHLWMQTLLPTMQSARWGRIINIISTSVKQPIPGLGVSNTIRGAMASWAKTLAHELGPHGITVNNILPGYTDTQRLASLIQSKAQRESLNPETIIQHWQATIPAGRFAHPREIAYGVLFLASPQADYINGINLPIDGGRTQCL